MSRLVRVSDDIYSALEIMQPDGWSMPKTIDAMLRPVINAISRVVTENEDSQEEFPVRVKKITEEIIEVLPQVLSQDEVKNNSEIFEEPDENISSEELEIVYEEIEKLKQKVKIIEEKISGGCIENISEPEKNLLKLFAATPTKESPSCTGFFGEPYVEAAPDEIRYYTQYVTKRIPASLPSSNGWNNFCWTLEMVFVWYDFEGTCDEMIAECEKRVAKKYAGRETLWIMKGLSHMTTPQRDELRFRQQIVNDEMRKRGLKEYDTVSII